jgi:hypothetical protein
MKILIKSSRRMHHGLHTRSFLKNSIHGLFQDRF